MNIDDAMARLNNNKKLYIALLKKFDGEAMLKELLEKIQNGDANGAEATAHALKGLAANLSLADLRKNAEEADANLKAGDLNFDTSNIEVSMALTKEAVGKWIAENS
ncbi:MAG: Hpt domain-containing protein [Oscillospiraceae bacterium]|nr:Hpt domain-containing protein [Oscillospiraceae bacterium]